jgi:Zn-dependent protease with chaperone function
MRRFLIGLAGGFGAGYLAVRAVQAVRDVRNPAPPLEKDPKSYGSLRRKLMLVGIARSLAELAFVAYGPAASLAPRDGSPEPRKRRVALLGAALVASTLFDLPAAYLEGPAIERRYGLSKQAPRAWAIDHAKAFGVSFAIGLVLLEGLASAIERFPKSWPYLATAAAFPLLVLANVIAPNLIAPLFNTFKALDGPLEERLRTLAARYGAGDATILRVDMSRQTEKANAYVTGLFGSKRIVVGDTLLEHFAEPEIEFVVAHELGHFVSRDVWRGVGMGTAAAAAIFVGARLIAERGSSLASAAGLGRLFFAASLLGLAVGPPMAAFMRSREAAADRFALAATRDAQAGIDAFVRLRTRNLAEEEQPRWMELLFSSHPSLRSRIADLERARAFS